MATFLQITPDPYSLGKKQLTGAKDKPEFDTPGDKGQYDHVRRPVRGVQIKDETFATLECRTKDGRNLLLVDSGGAIEKGQFSYSLRDSNFLIQNVRESRMEKYQLIKTFGDTYIFFFGEEPRVHDVTGILFNTADFNWAAEFWENYDKYLRGTQCVTNGTRVVLSYDDIIIQGYMLNAQATYVEDPQEYVPFSFQIIVSNYVNTSAIGSSEFPQVSSAEIFPDSVVAKNTPANQSSSTGEKSKSSSSLLSKIGKAIDFATEYGADAVAAYNVVSGYVTGDRDFVKDIDVSKGGFIGTNALMGATNSPGLYKLMKRKPPDGEAGSAFAFDQDHPVTYTYRTTTNRTPTTPFTFGKIRENTDEYIGKGASLVAQAKDSNRAALEKQYMMDNNSVESTVRKDMKDIGIGIDVPNDVVKAAEDGDFGTFSLGAESDSTSGLSSMDSVAESNFDVSKDSQIFNRIGRA